MNRQRLGLLRSMGIALALAILAALSFTPGAMAAAGDSSYVSNATAALNCSDDRCGAVRNIPAGWITTLCWRDGGSEGSNSRWFRVTSGGVQGWINLSHFSQQATVPYCSDLQANELLFAGQTIWSASGGFHLAMQTDGNLVLYGPSGARWATMTSGSNYVAMQGDGNFVVYRVGGGALWSSGTGFGGGTTLAVQSDGNLVEYAPGYGAAWAASWHENAGARSGSNAAAADQSQCTYYALEQWKNNNASHSYPAFKYGANAGGWVPAINGWPAYPQPMSGAMVVWAGSPGHVAWVMGTAPDGRGGVNILITDRNYDNKGTTRPAVWLHADSGLMYIPDAWN